MFLADYHTHTRYSFDSTEEPETLCKKALENGLTAIAITDHYECDHDEFECDMTFDVSARKEEIYRLKEQYKGRLDILHGIELGQPHSRPDVAKKVLAEGNFEFVIGSLHNIRKLPDFYYFDYTKVKGDILRTLIKRALSELTEIAAFEGIDTLAHITYIHRYVRAAGGDIDFKEYCDDVGKLYRILIKNEVSLEINTSTLWKGYGFTMPNEELLRLYRECGGRLVTVGSDAHIGENAGGSVEYAYSMLKRLSFDSVTAIVNGEKTLVKI